MSKKLTTEEFIKRGKNVHKDESENPKYDYSLVQYINNKTKVKIICIIHGVFEQAPASHLNGSICPKCSNEFSKTNTNEFIQKSNKIHNNKYDYSKTQYILSKEKVIIICSEHGEFEQVANSHLLGHGCQKCVGKSQLIKEDFIKKSNIIHNNKYDYSKVVYENSKQQIIIICPEHGEFEQVAKNHISGNGCKKCAYENNNNLTKKSNDVFIEQSNKIHNNKYNYSLTNYKSNKIKVDIICPIHGVFKQNPWHHINGCGCIKCSGTYLYSESEFVEKCIKKHNEKYDYSKVKYNNVKTKIKIICPEHGVFIQQAQAHLFGQGCPKCTNFSKGENKIHLFLESKNIIFEIQKTFDGCKNINKLPFDVYLPKHNIIIEYDGELHYISSEYFGGEEKLKSTQLNDQIKNEYCKNNNIPLLRIPYWDFKNIEIILTNFLKTHTFIISTY